MSFGVYRQETPKAQSPKAFFLLLRVPKERGTEKDALATLYSGAVGLQPSPEAQGQVRKVGYSATGVLELERILSPKATGCLENPRSE